MPACPAVFLLLAWRGPVPTTDPGLPITELVPVRVHGTDTSWPPVLVFCVLVVVVGGAIAAFVFLRRAREAARAERRSD